MLLIEGEESVGAKQNRTLNVSILAPAGREIRIPVACLERRYDRTAIGPTRLPVPSGAP